MGANMTFTTFFENMLNKMCSIFLATDEISVYAVPKTASARSKTAQETVTEPHLFRMTTALIFGIS